MRLPEVLRHRQVDAYKNMFGHVCIVAGSAPMLGAAALSSMSAMRSGAGLVTLAVPEGINLAAQAKIDNSIMTLALKQAQNGAVAISSFRQIREHYSIFNALAIGPGMGRQPGTQAFILKVVDSSPVPLVIDADGLIAVADSLDTLAKTVTPKILTPHPGEMARLTGVDKEYICQNRQKTAREFAKEFNCVLLLKGHETVVASPKGEVYINKTGNPGMATAGSGDVLTGIIAAFLAQGMDGFDAAKYGAYIHGKAGDFAAKANTQIAMTASDIITFLPEAFK